MRTDPVCFLLVAALALACSDSSGPGDSNGNDPGDGVPPTSELNLQVVASGFSSPLYLTSPPGDSRLFVVEQGGRIKIVANGQVLPTPFLDVSAIVASGGERGLLSVAFHPDYAANGYFYVNYTDQSGDTQVARYTVSGNPDVADPQSAKQILSVSQPFANHNGGLVTFGPDGMLYVGMGDGGSAGDPLDHGQNKGTLLGALLRIDVDGGDPYAIPPDNPFVDQQGARGEIWAYGLRNPWRFSFDAPEGLLYIADVGQNSWEEVNVEQATSPGLNYGWRLMEGTHCFNPPADCVQPDLELPVLEYDHAEGCSVTGGYVYRGSSLPDLQGHYFYADFCAGWVRSARLGEGMPSGVRQWDVGPIGPITSFGVDASGELYVVAGLGTVYRIS